MLCIRPIVRGSKPYVKVYSLCRSVITPVRERPNSLSSPTLVTSVSIHARVRERQPLGKILLWLNNVSIHAPMRGSDFLLFSPVLPYTVSIHAYLKSGSAAHIFYNAAPANAGKQDIDKKRAAIGKASANTENRQHAQLFMSRRIFRQGRNCLRQSRYPYRPGRTGLPKSIRVCTVRRT